MAYVWFNSILDALGKRLNYEAVVNLYGNAFAKDASKIVQGANPMLKLTSNKHGGGVMSLMGKIKIVEAKSKDAEKAALTKQLGNLDWAEGLI